jgi:hypothetical protein
MGNEAGESHAEDSSIVHHNFMSPFSFNNLIFKLEIIIVSEVLVRVISQDVGKSSAHKQLAVLVIMTAIIFIIISNPHILGNLPVRG